jgi:hypothetical protein
MLRVDRQLQKMLRVDILQFTKYRYVEAIYLRCQNYVTGVQDYHRCLCWPFIVIARDIHVRKWFAIWSMHNYMSTNKERIATFLIASFSINHPFFWLPVHIKNRKTVLSSMMITWFFVKPLRTTCTFIDIAIFTTTPFTWLDFLLRYIAVKVEVLAILELSMKVF